MASVQLGRLREDGLEPPHVRLRQPQKRLGIGARTEAAPANLSQVSDLGLGLDLAEDGIGFYLDAKEVVEEGGGEVVVQEGGGGLGEGAD